MQAGNVFLSGPGIERKIIDIMSRATTVRVAVAYWGDGTVERLKLTDGVRNDVTIVCDLMSGACNPTEIRRLRKVFGKSRVLTRGHLHAKVWLTDRGAIVGSSNASANGLGHEGEELRHSIEANLFIDDDATLHAIGIWFDQVRVEAREIEEADLREAKRLWKRNRNTRPLSPAEKSLLAEVKAHRSSFSDRDIQVWVYKHTGRDRWADEALKIAKKDRKNASIDCWQDIDSPIPPPGAYILDFDLKDDMGAKFDGIYQVLSDDPLVQKKGGNILLRKPVKRALGLSLGNKKTWEEAATRAAKVSQKIDEWELVDFRDKFLVQDPS